ncbi:MAG: LptA/OstA family protein [Leptotrichiaceae bacterium]|nr:LptA/OstA family protein [Leptotrichiaceae bacterium]
MWKKIAYGGLIIIVLYFLYAVFFKKIESPPVEKMKQEMRAKNVVYKLKDDAIIYADEQIGAQNQGDGIIRFKGVIIDLLKKDMLISAKEGEVNTKTSDITLKNNVIGRTKDNKWNIFTNHIDYRKEGDFIISDTRTKIVNNEDKTELEADKIQTTVKFEEIAGTGNVIYKKEEKELKADKIKYNDINKQAEAEGNVKYKDEKSNIAADRGIYFIEKKQVDARGNVDYINKDLNVKAEHVFYDEVKQIANAEGNGRFSYFPRNSTGTFRSGIYDLANEVLTTNQYYTMNYDDYKMNGTGLVYLFKTGDATLTGNFSVTKQNFTVNGSDGTMNTIVKNIFANNMIMSSVQGDRISSKTGEGSFEKKEFRFDGNINGKIRGNVKDFVNNPTKLVDSEAVHFRGNTAKVYFLSHSNNDMSITRSEIKENVHMVYKEVNLDSQYNEIDTSKNLVLARDQVILDFRNETQMTSNFLYLDLNSEIGNAQNNVKIVSKLPQLVNLNTSADKATVNMKEKQVTLLGNVTTYQGKTKISSKKAVYDINKKILENDGNIKMEYYVQNGAVNSGKTNSQDIEAVEEVTKRLSVSQNEVNSKSKIELPKTMGASNGTQVSIKWNSSNPSFLAVTGKINKEFLGGGNRNVVLKAVTRAGTEEREKIFNLNIPAETVNEMLERAAKNIYVPETGKNLPDSVKVNVAKGTVDVPVMWVRNGQPSGKETGTRNLTAILKYENVEYRKQF